MNLAVGCDPECLDGGDCSKSHTGTLMCKCQAGYSGVQCEIGMYFYILHKNIVISKHHYRYMLK